MWIKKQWADNRPYVIKYYKNGNVGRIFASIHNPDWFVWSVSDFENVVLADGICGSIKDGKKACKTYRSLRKIER